MDVTRGAPAAGGAITRTGSATSVVGPAPTWPAPLPPQPQTLPSCNSARPCQPPAEIAVTTEPAGSATRTGVPVSTVAAEVPNDDAVPHTQTLPPDFSASENVRPAAIAVTWS